MKKKVNLLSNIKSKASEEIFSLQWFQLMNYLLLNWIVRRKLRMDFYCFCFRVKEFKEKFDGGEEVKGKFAEDLAKILWGQKKVNNVE